MKCRRGTDTTLGNKIRELYYRSGEGKLYCYNVDSKENKLILTSGEVYNTPSLTGINMRVKMIFQCEDGITYSLNNDNTITRIYDKQTYDDSTTVLPLSSDLINIRSRV